LVVGLLLASVGCGGSTLRETRDGGGDVPAIVPTVADGAVDATDATFGVDAELYDGTICATEVQIHDTGSSNSAGFDVSVNFDGTITWQLGTPRQDESSSFLLTCPPQTGTLDLTTSVVSRLFADLNAAPLAGLMFNSVCGSVSFSSRTQLTYCGATIPNTQCGSFTDPRASALTADVNAVIHTINVAWPCG
jgi:hypothetical protein